MTVSLDEWVELAAEELEQDVRTHVQELTDGVSPDEVETLVRCIMVSIRHWAEEKGMIT